MTRREFLELLRLIGLSSVAPACVSSIPDILYPAPDFGKVTLLHFSDCHAQLLPVYYREPSAFNKARSYQGYPFDALCQAKLEQIDLRTGSKEAYAFSCKNFISAAKIYGKMGGFAALATLIKQIKRASKHGNVLLLDGGDTWQGSATALWTKGADMLAACNLLGVDVMTGHWEFTYGSDQVLANLKQFKGQFVAQNIALSEEAEFRSESESGLPFKPYIIKAFGTTRIAIIGQAYPYTPIANPAHLIPDWQFGVQEQHLQSIVNEITQKKLADVLVLLSHNGLAIDQKLASRISGLDIILGGHTHDALPTPFWINNKTGRTCVINSGSHGKFLSVLDLDIRQNRLHDLRYRLLPVFADLLEPDDEMLRLINSLRQPYIENLQSHLGTADKLLYRRDTFLGTFDQLLLDALIKTSDAQIALSPGFRWGTTLLPGQAITLEDVMSQTAITYPNTTRRNLSGLAIKNILEDAADNVFNDDPYYQQGGDMVRVGGMHYRCAPRNEFGKRISELRLLSGELVDANKNYNVVSWAAVSQQADGKPIYELVCDYLKQST